MTTGKGVLNGLRLLLGATTVSVVAWALLWPLPNSDDASASFGKPGNGGGRQTTTDGVRETTTESSYSSSVDWSRRFQGAEVALAKELQPESKNKSTQIQVSDDFMLVGTMIEEGNSFVMVQDEEGHVDLQPVGGVLRLNPPGAEVEEINAHFVVLNRNNRRTELRLQAAPAGDAISIEQMSGDAPEVMADDEEPEFSSLEQELDWLNGEFDEEVDEDFEDSDPSRDMEDQPVDQGQPSGAKPSVAAPRDSGGS